MDLQIALMLGQDGVVNGAIYGLLALAFGALSMAMMQAGKVPATLWLLLALAVMTLITEA